MPTPCLVPGVGAVFGAVGAPTGGGVSGLGLKYAVYFEGDNAQEGVPRTPASSDADYLRHGPPTRSESAHACASMYSPRLAGSRPPSSIEGGAYILQATTHNVFATHALSDADYLQCTALLHACACIRRVSRGAPSSIGLLSFRTSSLLRRFTLATAQPPL